MMFIGQLQPRSYAHNTCISVIGVKLTAALASKKTHSARYDRVEIGTRSQANAQSGIYAPHSNQLKPLGNISYTQADPDSRLQETLLPPSEQSSYSEEDALLNQYMKQSRIDGYFDGDTFVRTSSEPVKLILRDDITDADLQKFNSKLAEKGLGEEIDWRGVKSDFIQIGVGFHNVERFEQKADYLASRYAVLKDRIQSQYTGDKQESELQKLEQIYTMAKEEMADSYAGSIGSLYESFGQSGAAVDMRNSVSALIEQKANAYTDYIEKSGIGVSIADPDKQWLMQDDAYLAAKLRENVSSSSSELQLYSVAEPAPYDEKDLSFAGVCAKAFSKQLQNPDWNVRGSDTALGQRFALQYGELKNSVATAGVSEKLSNMLTSAFRPFMDRFMDSLDASITENRGWVAENSWMSGTIRTDYIDRKSVYDAFQNSIANQ